MAVNMTWHDYDLLWDMCKLMYQGKFMKIYCRRSYYLPDRPVQDHVMNNLWLDFDAFIVSWCRGLRFPWPPWHVEYMTRLNASTGSLCLTQNQFPLLHKVSWLHNHEYRLTWIDGLKLIFEHVFQFYRSKRLNNNFLNCKL